MASLAQRGLGTHGALVVDDPPLLQRKNPVGKPENLGHRVADVEHREQVLVAQPLQVGKQFVFAFVIERGKRFVQQQQTRVCQQSAADRNALHLSSR
ncbi:uncharacterized protein E1O_19210 [Burkholderiales bacterium GJ-E10]|nr:uncharacterized protein E1O_19210 [Burkholderiales bacterium GJ-E10]